MNNNPETLFSFSEVELIYKNKNSASKTKTISQSSDCHEILKLAWDENRIELLEEFKIILMDRRNRLLGVSQIATGGYSQCIVDPKVVFATALKAHASSIILAHNHPSGTLYPSRHDVAITKRMVEAGKFLEIPVRDHILLTMDNYYSFADNGLMPV